MQFILLKHAPFHCLCLEMRRSYKGVALDFAEARFLDDPEDVDTACGTRDGVCVGCLGTACRDAGGDCSALDENGADCSVAQ